MKEKQVLPVEDSAPTQGEGTKRHLQGRHLQMIAIGGTIGTGLFLKSGSVIIEAGPAGALFAYLIAGLAVFCVVVSLGEMATLFPISGSFNAFAERFVDPALGFTTGWTYCFGWIMTLPIEVLAASSLLQFWFPNVNQWIFISIIIIILVSLNLFTVKSYGETEYWLSIVKVLAIILFIIIGFVVIFKDHLYDFHTYNEPAPFSSEGPVKIFGSMVAACFAFGGTELVGITAGEAANPRVTVPKAINGTFWRIMLFYVVSIFVIGVVCSADYLKMVKATSHSSLLSSPFVIVFQIANIPGTADIMNFVAFVAVFSAGNSSIYAASRAMMALSHSGQGPKFLTRTSASGIPVPAVLLASTLGCLTFLGQTINGLGADKTGKAMNLFDWLVNIVGSVTLMTWILICVTHIRFRMAYAYQRYKLADLPYTSFVGVYGDFVGIVVCLFVIVLSGDSAAVMFLGKPFSMIGFITNYCGILLYPILYFGYKIYTGNWKFVPLEQVDLQTGHINLLADSKGEQEEEVSTWNKALNMLS